MLTIIISLLSPDSHGMYYIEVTPGTVKRSRQVIQSEFIIQAITSTGKNLIQTLTSDNAFQIQGRNVLSYRRVVNRTSLYETEH